jgi:ribosomal protein S27E
MFWWELGESTGFNGATLSNHRVTCAFCGEAGNFKKIYNIEKQDGSKIKTLYYEALQCINCGNYTMVF